MVFLTPKRTRKTRVKENRKITDFIHIADLRGPAEEPVVSRAPTPHVIASLPRCGKCTTEMLQRAGTVGEIGEVGDSRSSPQRSDGLP
jgi:hypothetical protein